MSNPNVRRLDYVRRAELVINQDHVSEHRAAIVILVEGHCAGPQAKATRALVKCYVVRA